MLIRVTKVAGFRVWSSVIDEEEIPAHARIDMATLGWTEWRSRFCDVPGVRFLKRGEA